MLLRCCCCNSFEKQKVSQLFGQIVLILCNIFHNCTLKYISDQSTQMASKKITHLIFFSQQVDDPPYLSVGTEVSAKYKGAFCEAKVHKVVRNIKCKVAYKQGLGVGTISDDQIKGDQLLRVGANIEVKHPDKRDFVEATINKIIDCSQYTVVFDDGDITTLRRSALCLKSGRHFNESETLDQLPLTHPEHFGNPVIGGRRGGRRSRHLQDDSSDDEEARPQQRKRIDKEENIGKVVCVEGTETKKKGQKENWFPGLVVARKFLISAHTTEY
jgi:hypothetical protein